MFFYIFYSYIWLSFILPCLSGLSKDGAHQYITIPISMTPGAISQSQAAATNKQSVKDTAKNINGRESPPIEVVTIKKECAD